MDTSMETSMETSMAGPGAGVMHLGGALIVTQTVWRGLRRHPIHAVYVPETGTDRARIVRMARS
jgi:hypothetical protein